MNLKVTKQTSSDKPIIFNIYVEGQFINLSDDKTIKNHEACYLITKQIKNTYNFTKQHYSCSISVNIQSIQKESEINSNKLLFCITPKVINNNIAQANFKGSIIKINNHQLNKIKSEHNRTIPHELGHIFGWDHPHANSMFESLNLECDPQFEQILTEKERQNNLMSQSWYIQKTGKSLDEGKEICLSQLELLFNNYTTHKLGNTRHLKGWWMWKKVRL